jgi:hypothetical protein
MSRKATFQYFTSHVSICADTETLSRPFPFNFLWGFFFSLFFSSLFSSYSQDLHNTLSVRLDRARSHMSSHSGGHVHNDASHSGMSEMT